MGEESGERTREGRKKRPRRRTRSGAGELTEWRGPGTTLDRSNQALIAISN